MVYTQNTNLHCPTFLDPLHVWPLFGLFFSCSHSCGHQEERLQHFAPRTFRKLIKVCEPKVLSLRSKKVAKTLYSRHLAILSFSKKTAVAKRKQFCYLRTTELIVYTILESLGGKKVLFGASLLHGQFRISYFVSLSQFWACSSAWWRNFLFANANSYSQPYSF